MKTANNKKSFVNFLAVLGMIWFAVSWAVTSVRQGHFVSLTDADERDEEEFIAVMVFPEAVVLTPVIWSVRFDKYVCREMDKMARDVRTRM